MQQLTGGGDRLISSLSSNSLSNARCACPSLFSSDVQVMSGDRSIVRIVMERVHGVPIDEFTQEAENKCSYSEAMVLSRELLLQLCPTLDRVSALCVHRDVNAHNILLG